MKPSVLVVGLGRFGTAAALELMALGHEVLAVDVDEGAVNEIAAEVTHAAQLDATDEHALQSVGAGDFEYAIVAISSVTDASIFATMALKNLGVTTVIAKAATKLHAAILERIGADRVVYAEQEMGQRVAHSLSIPGVVEYLDVAPRFGIIKIRTPAAWVGKSFKELDLASRQLSPLALRRGEEVTVNPSRDIVLGATDQLILLGRDERLEKIGR
ncbi:MAG TPA: TrkA family potassium uptake protein [Candidatus Saccharimonadales bacterium]|nr:TrkA family potassium uptake protein [Candidatus Saccharimonadales bacterium]